MRLSLRRINPVSIVSIDQPDDGVGYSYFSQSDLQYSRDHLSASTLTQAQMFASAPTEVLLGSYWYSSDLAYARTWDWLSLTHSSLGIVHYNDVRGRLGAAMGEDDYWIAASGPRNSLAADRHAMNYYLSRRDYGGGSWTTTTINTGANDQFFTPGVALSYDPNSGHLVMLTRKNDGEIVMRKVTQSGTVVRTFDTGIRAMGSPDVACTNAASSSTRNCIMVWIDVGRPISNLAERRLHWMEFRWNTTDPTVGSVVIEPHWPYYDLFVTAVDKGTADGFVVSQHAPWVGGGGHQARVLYKDLGSDLFNTQATLFDWPGFPAIAPGSVVNYADVFLRNVP